MDKALAQMHPNKALGPDGMSPSFFQSCWATVGDDLFIAIQDVFSSHSMHKGSNCTHIALIPKCKDPKKVSQYCPISSCNVTYKVVAKVLANRLKMVLPSIISERQSAFAPGRLITDNVLVAYELLHSMKLNKKGKDGFVAMKLDMSKAYDMVEWGFLEKVMRKMGFCEIWISLIMMCITTVSYSVLINGEAKGYIVSSRGLRQGDPLSPYLFLLCAEGLTAAISHEENMGNVNGVKVSRFAPRISHLFFADDSILFCKAKLEECNILKKVLEDYGLASVQKLNKEKTSLFFSSNVDQATKDLIKTCFGASDIKHHEKYLGLPSFVGQSKVKTFAQIKDTVWKTLQGWKEKLLSGAGKEILIKAVAQAIPAYSVSVFKLPIQLCRDLNSMVSQFWWGQKANERRIHWVKWEEMCLSKKRGGMGFRDLLNFDLALLAKQG